MISIKVSSINLPFSTLRIDSAFVIASGLIVFTFGLASWKLPIAAAVTTASSVATVIAVFAFGHLPVESGDVSFQPDLKCRVWQSETEWTEVISRKHSLLSWSNQPHTNDRQVNRDFTVSNGIDADGWRRLPVTATPAPEIWFLDWSFTFGVGVEDAWQPVGLTDAKRKLQGILTVLGFPGEGFRTQARSACVFRAAARK